jgi:hypothetical protein
VSRSILGAVVSSLFLGMGCSVFGDVEVSDEAVAAIVDGEPDVLAQGDSSNPTGETVYRGRAIVILPAGNISAAEYIEDKVEFLRGQGWSNSRSTGSLSYLSNADLDATVYFEPLRAVQLSRHAGALSAEMI